MKMEAPATPPRRLTRQRTPPSPTHGEAYNGLPPYRRRSTRLAGAHLSSPPASPQAPQQPKLHSGAAPAGDNGSSPDNTIIERNINLYFSADASSSNMLPTPSKTPSLTPARKRQRASSMQDSARILSFQPENPNDNMPTARDARKQKSLLTGQDEDYSLDISRPKKNAKSNIQIYTEVQARVPEDDTSSSNVFRDVPRGRSTAVSEPVERARQWSDSPSPPRPQKSVAERREEARMQAAVDRGEGVFYVFRGKKIYRKFADEPTEDLSAWSRQQQQLKRAVGSSAQRPITRSEIRPRFLWNASGEAHDLPQPSQTSYTDEEAETDVEMSGAQSEVIDAQEHDSVVPFVPPTVQATPVKQGKSSRKPMMTPPTTTRTTRRSQFDNVPSFEETLEADDEPPAEPILPTPQRSSRKKKVSINDVPTFEDDKPNEPTPARTRSKRTGLQLTPIVEDSDEPISAGPPSPGAIAGERRSKRSLFDSWKRTKAGKKRDSDAVADDTNGAPAKRSRSGTRSNVGSA